MQGKAWDSGGEVRTRVRMQMKVVVRVVARVTGSLRERINRQVEEFSASVKLDAIEPKIDGRLHLTLVVVKTVGQRPSTKLELPCMAATPNK